MPNLEMAKRVIGTAGTEPEHAFHRYPKDYILYELGTWDEEHAEFDLTVAPQRHGNITEITPLREEKNSGEATVGHEAPVFNRSER